MCNNNERILNNLNNSFTFVGTNVPAVYWTAVLTIHTTVRPCTGHNRLNAFKPHAVTGIIITAMLNSGMEQQKAL